MPPVISPVKAREPEMVSKLREIDYDLKTQEDVGRGTLGVVTLGGQRGGFSCACNLPRSMHNVFETPRCPPNDAKAVAEKGAKESSLTTARHVTPGSSRDDDGSGDDDGEGDLRVGGQHFGESNKVSIHTHHSSIPELARSAGR